MKRVAPHISINPDVRFGKPVIEGTRVPVEVIVGKVAAGMTTDQVAREYEVTPEQVRAALQYAATVVASEELLFT